MDGAFVWPSGGEAMSRKGAWLVALIAASAIAPFPLPPIQRALAQPMPTPGDCKYAPGPSAAINAYCDGYEGRSACVFGDYVRYCLEGRNRREAEDSARSAPTAAAPQPGGSAVVRRPAAQPRRYPLIDPNSALGRGIRLYYDLEYQRAWPVLLEATRIDPKDARGFAYLGAAYQWLGMRAEAEAARSKALALDPGILNNPAYKF